MNGLPYYRRFPRDFLEGTAGLSLEEKGAYGILLDLMYLQNGSLPDDPKYIAGNLGCSVRKWNIVRARLVEARKIFVADGVISNARMEAEIIRTHQVSEVKRSNAERGWMKRKPCG